MPGGLGPRFALEAGFLILLAAVAAYARLEATEIILVMAGGWLLTSIFEILAARRERLHPGATWERRVETDDEPVVQKEEPEAEPRLSWFRRPDAAAQPIDEAVAPEPPPPPPPPAAEADEEATGEIERPKRRRWFRRGPHEPEPPAEAVEARPSARHVRLIRGSASEGAGSAPSEGSTERKDAEAGS